jgi:Flp pilus assembly protein TadD
VEPPSIASDLSKCHLALVPWRGALALAALAGVLAAGPAAAHDSPGDALAALSAELAATPNDPELWLERVALQRALGDLAGARADLARACALGLSPARAERERGLNARAEGRKAVAATHLRRASELDPDDAVSLMLYAELLAELGRAREAAAASGRVIELAPGAGPDVWLAHARALAAAGDAAAASRALDAGLARLGSVPALEQEAIALELRAGRSDAALARLERTSGPARQTQGWRVQRAQILEQAGRGEEAQAEYAAALAALEQLPPGRRRAPVSVALAADARAGIERLARAPAQCAR